ncbi:MAG: TIM barrel protein [Fimbriimonadaceae bacterium]|jgi:sugar phosphate isomerase/epimerase|nr:TIM barrel protein [Fimbriimonadaceae bacterium]
MQVRFIKALWGMDMPSVTALDKIKSAGFDGFEASFFEFDNKDFVSKAHDLGLTSVCQVYVTSHEEVKSQFARGADAKADRINAHVGKDWWEFSRSVDFLRLAISEAAELGIPFCVETHRGRVPFTPNTALALCQAVPELRLTADYSHFTCVCESDLSDQASTLAALSQKVDYIHARVGHGEGPQVDDPRLEKNKGHCDLFLGFWNEILATGSTAGLKEMLVCPEFGPPPYMPTNERDEPVADLWEICNWTKDWLAREWRA